MDYPSTSSTHNNAINVPIKSRVDKCFVPLCESTSTKFPNKIFLTGPSDPILRKKWLRAARKKQHYSSKTVIRCCEDHFDLEKDVENWMKYKILGGKLFLKKGVVPHIFECQYRIINKGRREIFENIENTPDPPQADLRTQNTNTFNDKSVQVALYPHKRSKKVQVEMRIPQKTEALSPQQVDNGDSLQAHDGNKTQVFCPKCNAEISQTVKRISQTVTRIQEDQTRSIIARVYHYFEQEYEELKKSFDGLELTPLSKFRQRTALATGESETMVAQILQEEARRQQREETCRDGRLARKRARQTDSSSDEDSDYSAVHEEEMVVVKEELAEEALECYNEEPEIYVEMSEVKTEPGISETNDALADPISIDFKIEPKDEEATSSNETVVVQSATKSHKARKTKRSAVTPPSASAPPAPVTTNAPPRGQFYEKFKIPGVLGCVGGTKVSMIRPKQHEERYYCRKGYHTRNVLIINDADLNILHVDVCFGGATDDSYVFSNTQVQPHLETLNNNDEIAYLLGDSGYPQTTYLMTPFRNPQPGTPESHYNHLHSIARNSVERTIEILKGRFRCLLVHRALHYDPFMVGKIVKACCVLHNMCNLAGLPAPKLHQNDLDEETRLLKILRHKAPRHDKLESGQLGRRDLVSRLWRERHV